MGPFHQPQWPSWAYSGLADPFSSPYAQLSPGYPSYLADSMETYQAHHSRHLVHHQHISRATESKPRLSKEEVEVLEAEFQKNHKPSSTTKKALAESMRVDNARINNWFQNRRAREKKENNIREYEARQRLEKEKAEAESGRPVEASRQRDLVASSAPFPEPRMSSPSPPSPSSLSVPDATSETTEHSQTDASVSPPASSGQHRPVTPGTVDASVADAEPEQDANVVDGEAAGHADGYFAMANGACMDLAEASEPSLSAEAKASAPFFADYQAFMGLGRPDGEDLDHAAFAALPLAHAQPSSPLADEAQPKSPQHGDIASRRNRRPAPLEIAEGHGPPYAPRTATELDRRGGRASPIRRVASAAGAVRVTKPGAPPRSPFYDAKADLGFRTTGCSPSSTGHAGTRAPPTPDTPVALHQQGGLMDGAVSYALESKYMAAADMALQDATLRTPPTTPGFMDGLFGLGSGYDMAVSDETLMGPGLGRLPVCLDMPTMPGGVPAYVASPGGCSNQQHSELPLLSAHMGPGYLGGFVGLGANGQYSWSDVSPSTTRSSPGLGPSPAGYMDMSSASLGHARNQ